jgi:hypothetical protein
MHNDQQQQPDGVYQYVTFATIGFLAGIKAPLATLFGRLYALRVNDGSAWWQRLYTTTLRAISAAR